MEHVIHCALNIDKGAHIVVDERKFRMRCEARHIFVGTGGIVVHADDLVPALKKTPAQMRADEAAATSDENSSHPFPRSSSK